MGKRILVALCLLCMTWSPALAGQAVVAMDHYPPWKIIQDGKASGVDAMLITALLEEVGITPLFDICPWSRCEENIRTGDADFITGILKRPAREKDKVFIEPPYKTHSAKAFYIRRSSEEITSYEELKGLAIGTQLGAKYFPRFDKDASLRKYPVKSDTINFKKLAAGRVDVVILTESIGDYLLKQLHLNGKLRKAEYRHNEVAPVYFALSRKSHLMSRRQELMDAAQKLMDQGVFQQIIEQGLALPADAD